MYIPYMDPMGIISGEVKKTYSQLSSTNVCFKTRLYLGFQDPQSRLVDVISGTCHVIITSKHRN